ncbi:hypothetical protein C5N92_08505 [Glaesserella australis]|uniref:Uncharacterized protein n=1 Tax=Glaesserella australis TaxID=2094024 RepID=A0A328C187_9PAST|nr:hypothetical protein CJD39_05295 [Glaesserella sp. 15-184]RAL18254.1 hypothetical protein C5N92_08505 [Glaesserella australis]
MVYVFKPKLFEIYNSLICKIPFPRLRGKVPKAEGGIANEVCKILAIFNRLQFTRWANPPLSLRQLPPQAGGANLYFEHLWFLTLLFKTKRKQ